MLQKLRVEDAFHETLSHIVSDAYSAVIEPERWVDAVEGIRELIGAQSGVVMLHASRRNKHLSLVQAGLARTAVSAFVERHAVDNPWMRVQRRVEVGTVYDLDAIVPPHVLRRSDFFQSWLVPNGTISLGSGIILGRWAGCTLVLDLLVGEADVEALSLSRQFLQVAGRALAHAAELSHRLSAATVLTRRLEGALHAVPEPVLIVDKGLRCLHRNGAAERFIKHAGAIILGDDNVLRGATSSACVALEAGVANAHAGKAEHVMLTAGDGQLGALAIIQPLEPPPRQQRMFVGDIDAYTVSFPGARTAAGLRQPQISRVFSLTPAESALAGALLRGETLASYAKARGLSRNTVRNHLGSIMRKTRTHRQADVVRVLSQFAF